MPVSRSKLRNGFGRDVIRPGIDVEYFLAVGFRSMEVERGPLERQPSNRRCGACTQTTQQQHEEGTGAGPAKAPRPRLATDASVLVISQLQRRIYGARAELSPGSPQKRPRYRTHGLEMFPIADQHQLRARLVDAGEQSLQLFETDHVEPADDENVVAGRWIRHQPVRSARDRDRMLSTLSPWTRHASRAALSKRSRASLVPQTSALRSPPVIR